MLLAAVIVAPACRQETGRLSAARQQALGSEGLLHRADNLRFRYTYREGRHGGGWEDRLASIIVTKQSVLIHKNEKVGLEITPRSRRYYEVTRDGARVRVSAGSGQSAESWSFVPPDDADAWAQDIRAAIRGHSSTDTLAPVRRRER
ncbi:MAG TPA: hypothetical protein VFW66_07745 [Gemmatimonadales bacterium]|nr:hypothetical protein [Gemmatimonadales bacterium]